MRLKTQKNFMDHLFVKDLIKTSKKTHTQTISGFLQRIIDNFLFTAAEDRNFKIMRIVASMGIQGSVRISEIINLYEDDVNFLPNESVTIKIKVPKPIRLEGVISVWWHQTRTLYILCIVTRFPRIYEYARSQRYPL